MADASETLLSRGYEARREHRLADAREIFATAVEHYRKTGEQNLLAQSLTGKGQIERDLHHGDAALRLYEEAVAIYRSLDDPLRLAHTIRHLGDILRHEQQHAPAEACYSEALQIYRLHAETPPLDLANALRGFALLKDSNGDTAAAASLWREAGNLYATVNVQAGVDESKRQLALLAQR
jgi:tetratricopeptide (TPR) repeat protein